MSDPSRTARYTQAVEHELESGHRREPVWQEACAAAGGDDVADKGVGGLLVREVVDDDRGALAREFLSARPADTAGGAGDDGHLACQSLFGHVSSVVSGGRDVSAETVADWLAME